MNDILTSLNPQQLKAATHTDGPLVVFAGAGSGKTRIITTRIAYLISKGVYPWEILAVTFTNKAAKEMKERVEAICPEASKSLITTFHSACARWLREFAYELGYDKNFTIYDDSDSTNLLKGIIKKLHPKADQTKLKNEMKSFLHFVKTNGYFPSELEQLAQDYPGIIPTGGAEIYKKYQESLAMNNSMDFGDLIMNVLLLLRKNESVQKTLGRKYKYILVDEFQDTNRLQFELINLLSKNYGNLFVVGDDDQSIYSWRGAVPANIIDFDKVYSDAKTIALELNYRCTNNIVTAAREVIKNNRYRAEKSLQTEAPDGDLIELQVEPDGDAEAWAIADSINAEINEYNLDDIAIFYRTNSQTRILEDALRRNNLPYRIYGSLEFYDRVEIKDLMAFLKYINNKKDALSLKRIINTPTRGLGPKAWDMLDEMIEKLDGDCEQAIASLVEANVSRVSPKLRLFSDLIQAIESHIKEEGLRDAVPCLLEALDYPEYLKKKYPDQYIDKVDNIQELQAGILDYIQQEPEASLSSWLESVTLIRDKNEDEVGPTISLMTLHMAKGLEFPRVYICGFEEGLIPHKNSSDDTSQLEEERRLLYVGITRAKKKLSLLGAERRRTYNNININAPSRFSYEIPESVLEMNPKTKEIIFGSNTEEASTSSSFDDDYDYESYDDGSSGDFVGKSVYHPTYGKGVLISTEDSFGVAKVVVDFTDFGLRKIRASQLKLI